MIFRGICVRHECEQAIIRANVLLQELVRRFVAVGFAWCQKSTVARLAQRFEREWLVQCARVTCPRYRIARRFVAGGARAGSGT